MSRKPTSAEARDLRALLEAIHDAVTLDYAAPDYERRLVERASLARTVLDAVAKEPADEIAWNADWLRGKLAAEQADAEKRETNRCGRCRRLFDPNDTRFDGHDRYGDTPWCRSCIDTCHEGSAEHVCIICDPSRYGGEPR
ncbi:hypothetical protein [Streptomyces sp. MUM 16J]|uniref:hypothetical protein n=1 Tax=Streptomyces sp. MUM 16J TaxID=2791988 RepID=UPI001F04E082|nr:hypothetical protein [Streptomyces sp. MUM 16J]MCH0555796.1 hypothetical protein [Streptomyces sp. MUM 16J]